MIRMRGLGMTAALLMMVGAMPARAEVKEITVVVQNGINYLPLMVMKQDQLIEKRAAQAGFKDFKVNWSRLGTASAVNDALLSGQVNFAAVGVSSLVTLWAKTKENAKVRSIAAVCSMPIYMVTRNPDVKSIKDLSQNDRIALPGVKVSVQAVLLEMAVAKEFGPANYAKLDPLTVSMSQPEGMIALLTKQSQISSHFGGPPYQYEELLKPGMTKILSSYDIFGGGHTYTQIYAIGEFYDANPKVSKAFFEALQDANQLIKTDKKRAIEVYRVVSDDKRTSDEVLMAILNDPDVEFTVTPKNTMAFAKFMHSIGSVKVMPESWKDMFFPLVHSMQGS
jgi:NitT/TauT family transport system substrate-binding protein